MYLVWIFSVMCLVLYNFLLRKLQNSLGKEKAYARYIISYFAGSLTARQNNLIGRLHRLFNFPDRFIDFFYSSSDNASVV